MLRVRYLFGRLGRILLKVRFARSRVGALTAAAVGSTLLLPGLAATASADSSAAQRAASVPLPYEDASLPVKQRVADLLGRMTLEEKVGQMTQAERAELTPDASPLSALGLGSVLSGGGSVPTPNTPQAWADMVDAFQREALKSRLKIPIIY